MELIVGCPEEASRDDPDHPSLEAGERSVNNSGVRNSAQEPESPRFFMLL